MMRSLIAMTVLAQLAGCTTAEYYWQGIRGQFDLLGRAEPIASVVDGASDPALKHKLERVVAIRMLRCIKRHRGALLIGNQE